MSVQFRSEAVGETEAGAAGRPLRRAVWAVFLAPAGLMLWSAYAMWATWSPTPFSDQWSDLYFWKTSPPSAWLHYLLAQHNEHRLFVPRLVFLADRTWLQGRDGLNLAIIGLTQLLGAAFFIWVARPLRAGTIGLLALATALSLVFSLMQWENLFWGFQVQFVGVYAFATWALYAFCRATATPPMVSWGWMAGAFILLVVATFNMANGVLTGVVMVLLAILQRRGLAAAAAAAGATAILFAVYLHGYHVPGYHAPPSLALRHPGRFLTYIVALLGSIWAPGQTPRAALIGLAGGLATAGMVYVVARDRSCDTARAALLGTVLFVSLSAAMTSLGRIHLGVGQALSSRYMTPAAYFWGAQAVFWAGVVTRDAPRAARVAVTTALALSIVRLLAQQGYGFNQLFDVHNRMVRAESALLGGIEDRDALLGVYPNLAILHEVVPFLRERRLSVFADPVPVTPGARFSPTLSAANICRGAFDVVTAAPQPPPTAVAGLSAAPPAWRAEGWGWDLKARHSISRVILADDTGVVHGIGVPGVRRDDVWKAVREVTSLTSGWSASMDRGTGRELIAYGITAAGPACELGRKAWPQ